ncbi:hypothetical protein DRO02_04960 [archaeon]|nr:MAG: hypothetical protein DRO21_04665 [archaeon]RLG64197.1 MAG: hypothetical protein DRO02_04960 [archaeon]
MPTLSTGFIRAAGYARKARRVLFATARNVDSKEVVRASAEFNMKLFERLQEMGVRKEDIVRIRCDFDIVEENGEKKIVWNWDTLDIEVYVKGVGRGETIEKVITYLEDVAVKIEELITSVDQSLEKLKELVHSVRGQIEELKAGRIPTVEESMAEKEVEES